MYNILIINAAGNISGDVRMWLLGLSYLPAEDFHLHVVSIPRGLTYTQLTALPNATITSMEPGGTELRPVRKRVIDAVLRSVELFTAIVRIIVLVLRNNIDCIFALDRTISLRIAYVVSRLTNRPLILNMHTTYYFFTPGFHQRVMQHARFLTALTETMRQQAKVVVSDIQRIVVLPNAIDLQPYDLSLTGSHIRRDFDIPLDAQVIVLAGRFSPYKGQEELIHASALFMHKYVHTYILLAGNEDDVEFTAHIQSLIDQYNLGNRIKMIGYRSDIPEVMACANIVVMPSRDEPFGLVALEGMAMGKPVVATRVGGIPSFIKDGETGLLIDPCDPQALAEAISLLLDNPDIAKTIGERARAEVIEHYHADIYGQRFVSFMRDALQQL